jgi:hypothetical protein
VARPARRTMATGEEECRPGVNTMIFGNIFAEKWRKYRRF